MKTMKKKILLTGGCGFIGSNIYNKLSSEYDITVVDNLSAGVREFIPVNSDVRVADFSDTSVVQDVENSKYALICHQAAVPRVEYSVQHPYESHEENVNKSLILFHAAAKSKTPVVFASSSAVYGDALQIPTQEDCHKLQNSPYGLHKYVCEQYLELYSRLYGLYSISLRYFNVYGPNQLGNSAYSTAISSWLHRVKRDQSCRMDGTGEQRRDMVFVEDVVQANAIAIKRLLTARSHAWSPIAESYNVGTGTDVSNNEIMTELCALRSNVKMHVAPKRPGDVERTCASIDKIKLIGYKPTVALKDGLKLTYDWAMKSELF